MNAFSKPMNAHPHLMTVQHGRKGQATEYVEYRPHKTTTRYAAQKSGDWFIVMRLEVNKHGRVKSSQLIGSFTRADSAAHQAHDAAMNDAAMNEEE